MELVGACHLSRNLIVRRRTHEETSPLTGPGGGGFVNPLYPCSIYAEQVFYDGAALAQVDSLNSLGPGKFYVEGAVYGGTGADKNTFISTAYVIRDNPTNHELRIANLSRFVSILQPNCTLRGIGIRRYSPALVDFGAVYSGSRVNAGGLTIEHVHVEDIANLGVQFSANNGVIRNTTIQRCGQLGVAVSGDNTQIERNYLRHNMNARYNYGPNGGGIECGKSWNTTVRYNQFVDTFGHSLWFDESCYMSYVYSNDFINSYGHGIAYEISARAYIVDNYFEDIGVKLDLRAKHASNPIWLSGSGKCEVWNNTIVNSEQYIAIAQDYRSPTAGGLESYGRDTSRPSAFYDGSDPNYEYNGEMTWTVTRGVFKNNLLYKLTGSSTIQSVFYEYFDDSANSTVRKRRSSAEYGIVTEGNLYNRFSTTATPRFTNGTRVVVGG